MATTPDSVAAIAAAFADAETKANSILTKVRALKDEFDSINANGDAGFLITKKSFYAFDALVTQFNADLYALHSDLTVEAQARNIDLPSILSGGGR